MMLFGLNKTAQDKEALMPSSSMSVIKATMVLRQVVFIRSSSPKLPQYQHSITIHLPISNARLLPTVWVAMQDNASTIHTLTTVQFYPSVPTGSTTLSGILRIAQTNPKDQIISTSMFAIKDMMEAQPIQSNPTSLHVPPLLLPQLGLQQDWFLLLEQLEKLPLLVTPLQLKEVVQALLWSPSWY